MNTSISDVCMYEGSQIALTTPGPDQTPRQQREYLDLRLSELVNQNYNRLQRQFGLSFDMPKTAEEAVQRIKDGKFTIEPKKQPDWCWSQRLSWADPTVTPDPEGYEKALEGARKTSQPVEDAIAILDPKDALKLLQEFEATTVN